MNEILSYRQILAIAVLSRGGDGAMAALAPDGVGMSGLTGSERAARALLARGEAMAARRAGRRTALLAQIYGEALPDAQVSQGAGGVLVRARGLRARLMRDARLRWPGGWLR